MSDVLRKGWICQLYTKQLKQAIEHSMTLQQSSNIEDLFVKIIQTNRCRITKLVPGKEFYKCTISDMKNSCHCVIDIEGIRDWQSRKEGFLRNPFLMVHKFKHFVCQGLRLGNCSEQDIAKVGQVAALISELDAAFRSRLIVNFEDDSKENVGHKQRNEVRNEETFPIGAHSDWKNLSFKMMCDSACIASEAQKRALDVLAPANKSTKQTTQADKVPLHDNSMINLIDQSESLLNGKLVANKPKAPQDLPLIHPTVDDSDEEDLFKDNFLFLDIPESPMLKENVLQDNADWLFTQPATLQDVSTMLPQTQDSFELDDVQMLDIFSQESNASSAHPECLSQASANTHNEQMIDATNRLLTSATPTIQVDQVISVKEIEEFVDSSIALPHSTADINLGLLELSPGLSQMDLNLSLDYPLMPMSLQFQSEQLNSQDVCLLDSLVECMLQERAHDLVCRILEEISLELSSAFTSAFNMISDQTTHSTCNEHVNIMSNDIGHTISNEIIYTGCNDSLYACVNDSSNDSSNASSNDCSNKTLHSFQLLSSQSSFSSIFQDLNIQMPLGTCSMSSICKPLSLSNQSTSFTFPSPPSMPENWSVGLDSLFTPERIRDTLTPSLGVRDPSATIINTQKTRNKSALKRKPVSSLTKSLDKISRLSQYLPSSIRTNTPAIHRRVTRKSVTSTQQSDTLASITKHQNIPGSLNRSKREHRRVSSAAQQKVETPILYTRTQKLHTPVSDPTSTMRKHAQQCRSFYSRPFKTFAYTKRQKAIQASQSLDPFTSDFTIESTESSELVTLVSSDDCLIQKESVVYHRLKTRCPSVVLGPRRYNINWISIPQSATPTSSGRPVRTIIVNRRFIIDDSGEDSPYSTNVIF